MEEYTTAQCHQLLNDLFPNGFASDDIMSALAPNGWENSPYALPVPTVEEAYQAAKACKSFDELMARIQSGNVAGIENIEDFESFEDFKAHYQVETPNYTVELQETVANCLWDIFSDNNDVVKDNKVYQLGSFRGSARFIADWLNTRSEKEYTYIDFYMGNSVQDDDNACDFSPVYALIFARLKQAGLDWVYNFSQLRLVDLSAAKEQKADEPANYDPNKALEQQLKQKEEQQEKDDFKAKIEEMNAKAREDALYKPPPTVVQAYRIIYGRFPIGWPPAV